MIINWFQHLAEHEEFIRALLEDEDATGFGLTYPSAEGLDLKGKPYIYLERDGEILLMFAFPDRPKRDHWNEVPPIRGWLGDLLTVVFYAATKVGGYERIIRTALDIYELLDLDIEEL